jgi:hypothetical protein
MRCVRAARAAPRTSGSTSKASLQVSRLIHFARPIEAEAGFLAEAQALARSLGGLRVPPIGAGRYSESRTSFGL